MQTNSGLKNSDWTGRIPDGGNRGEGDAKTRESGKLPLALTIIPGKPLQLSFAWPGSSLLLPICSIPVLISYFLLFEYCLFTK